MDDVAIAGTTMAVGLTLAWLGLVRPWLRAPVALAVAAFLALGGTRTPWTSADGHGRVSAGILLPLPRPEPRPLPFPAPKPVRLTDLLDQVEERLI